MKIISYEYQDPIQPSWSFSKIKLKKTNLFVGESGSGKSRILNTISNLSNYVLKNEFRQGHWKIEFIQDGNNYFWEILSEELLNDRYIKKEILIQKLDDSEKIIIERTLNDFKFNGTDLPKLSKSTLSVHLLKDEGIIEPIYKGFSKFIRRNFFEDELKQNCLYQGLPIGFSIKTINNIGQINSKFPELSLNTKLFILKESFPKIFNQICTYYKTIFPTIENMEVKNISSKDIPFSTEIIALLIKEKHVDSLIGLQDLSSGMQKVLLLITDILTMQENSIYLIDEYENSLGIGAVNFLPSFLEEFGNDNQFILTSHHPYLINNIPVKNWYVFHRKGSNVTIKYGEELEKRYGKSKQQAFIKLINDSFYIEGIE
ncbi:MAG: ATP-binding protein [Deltaproteobacteria bacterium]|nr:ATP-binding protein [Deltaproteobacteria bacterium]